MTKDRKSEGQFDMPVSKILRLGMDMANKRVLIFSNIEVENYLVQNLSNYTAQQIIAYPDNIKLHNPRPCIHNSKVLKSQWDLQKLIACLKSKNISYIERRQAELDLIVSLSAKFQMNWRTDQMRRLTRWPLIVLAPNKGRSFDPV